jgi:NarL family two-component system response regulator LiaR
MDKIKVLIADDQVLFSSGLRKLLEAENDFEVVGEACDGPEAVSFAANFQPDIVIMDVNMSKLSGIEAAKQIKDTVPASNILMLSAYKYDSYIIAAMRAKVAGFLYKGISFNELVLAIRAIKSGKHVLDETAAFNILSRLVSADGTGSPVSLEHLHDREIEVLKQAAKGMTNKEIAEKLELSERTIQSHFANIFRKLNVNSRTEAIFHALKEGWLSLEDIR